MPCSFFLLTTFTDGLIFISLILWLCYFQAWKLHNCKIWLWLANWLQPPFTAQHRLQQAVATKQCTHRRFQYTYTSLSRSIRNSYFFRKYLTAHRPNDKNTIYFFLYYAVFYWCVLPCMQFFSGIQGFYWYFVVRTHKKWGTLKNVLRFIFPIYQKWLLLRKYLRQSRSHFFLVYILFRK